MEHVKISMTPKTSLSICHVTQNDNGREVSIDFEDYTLTGAEDVSLIIRKPDGARVETALENTTSNFVIWSSVPSECDVVGLANCEIKSEDDGVVLYSASFNMNIEADPYGSDVTTLTATGNPCTFTTDLADALVSLTADIVCGGGNGTPSTPIPIVGHSELNLTRCGKNLFDKTTTIDDNWINSSGSAVYFAGGFYSALIPVKPNTAYYLSNVIGGTDFVSSVHFDNDMNVIGVKNVSGPGIQSGSITTFNNSAYMRINSNTANKDTVMVSEGSTATAYEPYNGQTFTVSFGQTVYGGVYDKSGSLTITHALYTFDGSENWDNCPPDWPTYGHCFTTSFSGSSITLCDRYDKDKNAWNTDNGIIIPWSGTVAISDSRFSSPSDFRAEVAINNIYVVYPLATPIVIDVDAISPYAKNGTNTITSDCIGDVSVSYIDTIQHYIDTRL